MSHLGRIGSVLVWLGACSVVAPACEEPEEPGVETPVEISAWPPARPAPPWEDTAPWTHRLRLFPFDILVPDMTDGEIDDRLDAAATAGANAVIFYLEEEHMYGTFVDEAGFAAMRARVEVLTAHAATRSLRTLVYLNGLEVMTRGAYDEDCQPTGVPTLATTHPEWLQRDLAGDPIVFACQSSDWLEPDWEDAWLSPYSGYLDLFRSRIDALGEAGVDAFYVDATFLPGFQPDDEHLRWGSTDEGFAQAFLAATGFAVPTAADAGDPAFRAFLAFRHEAVATYLAALRDAAEPWGPMFWESSAGDTPEAVRLGNDTAVTGRVGIGCSPEIEPEGDYLAAFRQAKAVRDLNGERPLIYLGWPEDGAATRVEFAVAVAHSGNYYPTADAAAPAAHFARLARIQPVLDARLPYGGDVLLLYSVRNQDWTLEAETFFAAYEEAATWLLELHVPFRIAALETLDATDLHGVTTAILPGLVGISDAEADLLSTVRVVPLGDDVGTRDGDWVPRAVPVAFPEVGGLEDVRAALPFHVTAPRSALIEYHGDRAGRRRLFLFIVSPEPEGEVVLGADAGETLEATTYPASGDPVRASGALVTVPIEAELTVVEVSEGG